MKKFTLIFALLLVLLTATISPAVPSLQLGIEDGYYDTTTETIMSSTPVFNLIAYLDETDDNSLSDTYYISAAVVPMTSVGADLGSFTFNGDTIDVTGEMTYGTPPLDVLYPDLGSHGIYDTFYKEFDFTFSGATTAAINTDPTDPDQPTSGTLYYAIFNIDTTDLADGYFIHFDLYNENIKLTGNPNHPVTHPDTLFAPFSHDAQSDGHKVPEPGTLLLLGSGLLGLGFFGRKKFRK